MPQRGIVFSAVMVVALKEQRKVQTRRLAHAQATDADTARLKPDGRCPFGEPGARLYVKEAWRAGAQYDHLTPITLPVSRIWYEADGAAPAEFGRYRNARFMPEHCSRIALKIDAVALQRLHAMTASDAIAEGIEHWQIDGDTHRPVRYRNYALPESTPRSDLGHCDDPLKSYRTQWELMHGAEAWTTNPWIWALTFHTL